MKAEFVVGHSPEGCPALFGTSEGTAARLHVKSLGDGSSGSFHASSISSFALALSLCLARMLVVEGTLLEMSEWIRSFCHLGSPTDRYSMEKRGENSEVTQRTYAFLTRVIRACASYV